VGEEEQEELEASPASEERKVSSPEKRREQFQSLSDFVVALFFPPVNSPFKEIKMEIRSALLIFRHRFSRGTGKREVERQEKKNEKNSPLSSFVTILSARERESRATGKKSPHSLLLLFVRVYSFSYLAKQHRCVRVLDEKRTQRVGKRAVVCVRG